MVLSPPWRRGALAVVVLALALAAPSAATAASYRAGAAVQVTTPPVWSTQFAAARTANATFAPEFAQRCPESLFPAHGRFALQEPFNDGNGNGQWDSGETGDRLPEAFCDANANGRWDGIYTSGQNATPARGVHDDIDVRAFAVAGASGRPLVYASVAQQGLFENYTDRMRAAFDKKLADAKLPASDLVVSATHNESSPDTVGIYGALTIPGVNVSARSGIDEYYLRWLIEKVAQARSRRCATCGPPSCTRTRCRCRRPSASATARSSRPSTRSRTPGSRRPSTPRSACCRRARPRAPRSSRS